MIVRKRQILVLGFALFAMFFGAGNLIFPPTLGRLFGDRYWLAIPGFLLTGVGLPLMGILAVAKADGGIDKIAARVDRRIAKILTLAVMLAIGPLLAIPRTCATTFELGIAPNFPWLNTWLFSFAYFAVVLVFTVNPLSVVDLIGKILTPLLLLALLALIVSGVIWPVALPAATMHSHVFGRSLVEGYQTMDLMAATIFGIVMLNDLKNKGIGDKRAQISTIVKAGIISACGLAVVYGGLIYLGATSGAISGDLTRTELLVAISQRLMGTAGATVLGVAVSMACLTTAIGLTAVCGEYFSELKKGRIGYKSVCVAVCAVSFVLSNAGVEMIVRIAIPALVALYPTVMVMVVLTLFSGVLRRRNIWRGAVAGAFSYGIIDALHRSGIEAESINALFDVLPLTNHGLGWLLPAAILGIAGGLVRNSYVKMDDAV